MKTELAETLAAGRLAVTAECHPPRGADAAAVRRLAGILPARLDAVVVSESAIGCAAILAGEKHHPVLSLITRDRNRMALEVDALGAVALGVGSMLCLSGDHQSLGTLGQAQAAGAYDIDSVQLLAGLRRMCEEGTDFAGRKLESNPGLFLGAAAHPNLRPMELNLMRVKKKIAAGAKFLMTQAVFDLAGFGEWMDAVRAAGLEKKTAIIASVLPLTSVEQAKRWAKEHAAGGLSEQVIGRLEKAADPVKEGIAIAAELARKLKEIPGVRGIHIFSGGCESSVAAVLQEAGLSQA